MKNFSVLYRNFGHWDIYPAEGHRLFRVRGGPGTYRVLDEREPQDNKGTKEFKTVQACMSYICDELMFELIVVEGQSPQIIESWNI